jgi:hypothetical protein
MSSAHMTLGATLVSVALTPVGNSASSQTLDRTHDRTGCVHTRSYWATETIKKLGVKP